MKTCPNCGAENLQTASSCRMCATPIESPQDLLGIRADTPFAEEIPPSNLISGREPQRQHAPASTYAGHVICPVCEAVNEQDWLFCQDCGTSLKQDEAQGAKSVDSAHSAYKPEREARPQIPPEEHTAPNRHFDTDPPRHLFTTIPPERSREVFKNAASSSKPAVEDQPQGSTASASGASQSARPPVVCRACGAAQPHEGAFCTHCGAVLSAAHPPVIEVITEGGEVGEVYSLDLDDTSIGRVEGEITFPHDGYLSSRHARIIKRDGRYFLLDDGSRNGTFIRIDREIELKPGDVFLIGKQVLRFGSKS